MPVGESVLASGCKGGWRNVGECACVSVCECVCPCGVVHGGIVK